MDDSRPMNIDTAKIDAFKVFALARKSIECRLITKQIIAELVNLGELILRKFSSKRRTRFAVKNLVLPQIRND